MTVRNSRDTFTAILYLFISYRQVSIMNTRLEARGRGSAIYSSSKDRHRDIRLLRQFAGGQFKRVMHPGRLISFQRYEYQQQVPSFK